MTRRSVAGATLVAMDGDLIRHRLQLGLAARRAGQTSEAEANMVAAVAAARNAGNTMLLCQALAGLGQVERDLGRQRDALSCYAEALGLARIGSDPLQVAYIARHVGDILLDAGDLLPAERHLREALAIERADPCTPQREIADCLLSMGRLESALNNRESACSLLTEARVIYNTLEITAGVTDCDERLATLLP